MVASFNKKEIYEVKNMQISSVEKGNYGKVEDSDVFVAFSGKVTGLAKSIKLILKGKQACCVYSGFLADGISMNQTIDVHGTNVERSVGVSFTAVLKEERPKETVLINPEAMSFNFNFNILEGK